MLRAALFLAVIVLSSAPGATPATHGVTFRVTSPLDKPDNKPGDGICDATPPTARPSPKPVRLCTLRAAIQETNALGGANTIVLGSATYVLTIAGTDEEAAATGDLDVSDNLSVN